MWELDGVISFFDGGRGEADFVTFYIHLFFAVVSYNHSGSSLSTGS